METQLLSPKRGRSPKFFTHICCGQMAGWIKMPLGRDIGLRTSDIVLDVDPAPLPKEGAEPPNFRPISGVAKWLDGSRCLIPSNIVLDGDPAPLPPIGGRAPKFWPMFIVAKWLDGSRCYLVGR